MEKGKLLKQGTPQQLIGEMEDKTYEVLVNEKEQQQYEQQEGKIANIMLTSDRICLRVVSDTPPQIGQVQKVRANLEDVYLYWVG